jgi:hypothetical protein
MAIAFVALTVSFSKGYQSADEEHSTYYAERDQAEIRYRECLETSTSLDGARECINNAEATSRDSERAEKDLNAQREMAQWAEGMLWAAWTIGFLSLGITLVGVRYVYLTLIIATQNMARDATRIGQAQVMAYFNATNLVIREEDFRITTFEDGAVYYNCNLVLDVSNVGNSPAKKVDIVATGHFSRKRFRSNRIVGNLSVGVHEIDIGIVSTNYDPRPDFFSGESGIQILITYDDVFDRRHHESWLWIGSRVMMQDSSGYS